jgi:hypothetical protein
LTAYIVLELPEELRKADVSSLDLQFRETQAEVDLVFDFIDMTEIKSNHTKKGYPKFGDIAIRYRLRDNVETVSSIRVIATADFEVETGPLFVKRDAGDPDEKVIVDATGKRVRQYGTYYYDDYSYEGDDAEKRREIEEARKAAFDQNWKENFGEKEVK